ncbi:hypothetical protein C0J45_8794 [Silurus meridionalis]|nr:hypothetical protein C0J45_8794 [Silurus meridionalis]
MISRGLLLVLLVLTCLQSFTMAENSNVPATCCFSYQRTPIPIRLITGYKVTDRHCAKPGVIFTLKSSRQVLQSPSLTTCQDLPARELRFQIGGHIDQHVADSCVFRYQRHPIPIRIITECKVTDHRCTKSGVIEMQPQRFPTFFLEGRWRERNRCGTPPALWKTLTLQRRFQGPYNGRPAAQLASGNDNIMEYSLCFRTLAASSGWNETALLGVYRLGLAPDIKQAMAIHDDTVGLEKFIQKSFGLSQRSAACHPTPLQQTPSLSCGLSVTPAPQWSPQCKEHCLSQLSSRITRATVGTTRVEEATTATQVEIPEEYQAFRDMFCAKAATRLPPHWPWDCCINLLRHPSKSPPVHEELGTGHPGKKECKEHCLSRLPSRITRATVGTTRVEEATTATQVEILEEYQAFRDVFCAKAATRLPPHRPWDCCIDLLPGAKQP